MANRQLQDKKKKKLTPCHLWCQDPDCPHCFPQLGADDSQQRSSSGWRSNNSQQQSLPLGMPGLSSSTRSISAELVELVVVLCTKEGSRRHVLSTVRCHGEETLSSLRTLLRDEIHSLPANFGFLRVRGGDVVRISADQESGHKPYKAKHFLSPTPHLFIYDKGPEGLGSPQPQPSSRQITRDIIEFSVKRLIDGQPDKEPALVGMIRLNRDATLQEVRRDLAEQIILDHNHYRFVRMLHGQPTFLTAAQESCDNPNPLRVYHFAPPYTEQPEIILFTQKTYTEGEILQDETKTRELKSLASALRPPGSGKSKKTRRNPRDMVKDKAPEYINAFLNSAGGVLIFGASDDGTVERVPIAGYLDDSPQSLDERVALARSVKDDIRKLVDSICITMDPVVDVDMVTTLFVPVKRSRDDHNDEPVSEALLLAEEEIFNVIEVHVKPGRRSLYFLDCHSTEVFERRDGSTRKMDPGNIAEALNREHEGRTAWNGGWRQLRSSFDFNNLMRRLSDPWAGREWLFAATRQHLFRQMAEPLFGKCGLLIVGSRGMGMTSFMAELALRPKHVTNINVVAHHLCRADDVDTLSPALFVNSLAAMLARNCKEFRLLMIEASKFPDRDTIGATMLRALQIEHCEDDPVDAFIRGIVRPLHEIDALRSRSNMASHGRNVVPMAVLIDAIDESLVAETASIRRRSSESIAHILERGLTTVNGLPSWIKFVVSCRKEMAHASGPIQRLASQLTTMDLDPDLSCQANVDQARDDIRLFIDAFIASKQMVAPSGRIGNGHWTHEDAALAERRLRILRGKPILQWQSQVGLDGWAALDDSMTPDFEYSQKLNLQRAYVCLGKQLYVADLVSKTLENLSTGHKDGLRAVEIDSREISLNEQEQRESELLDSLATNSQGNYLYARSVLEDVSNGLPWKEVPDLPRGLDLLYSNFFRSHLLGCSKNLPDGSEVNRSRPTLMVIKPVLEILLAATKHGITEREITHAIVAGGACDPSAVAFCLRDLRWALDVDSSSGRGLPRYSLRHESIRSWLRDESNRIAFELQEQHGHALLAASLMQRCWPQQACLSAWLREYGTSISSQWDGWVPNADDEDVYNLVLHLVKCNGSHSERVDLLKTIGEQNLNSVHRNKATALHSACTAGITSAVDLLLRAGARSDIAVRGGRLPIHVAASKGHRKTCEILLAHGANVSLRTTSGRTALLNAVCRGSLSTVQLLLTWMKKREDFKFLINASQTDTGRTPLSFAVEEGYDKIALELISSGAAVFLADHRGRTPMFYAARQGNAGLETVKALYSAPRGPDTLTWGECKHRRTPLHTAVWHGRLKMVEALIKLQIDLNLTDEDGMTALHEAACYGSCGHELLHWERTLSADESSKIEAAAQCQSSRQPILELLLESGRCIGNIGDVHGCTPLWYAAGGGWTQAVVALLDAGAVADPGEIERMPGKGRNGPASPLLNATIQGHYETANVLLAHGARRPPSHEIDEVYNAAEIPEELLESMRSAHQDETGTADHYVQVMGYQDTTMAVPVPKEAFAAQFEANLTL